MHKNIVLLGSTGSIGTQTLDIAAKHNLNILALSAKFNVGLLESQARLFKPEYVSIANKNLYKDLKLRLHDTNVKVLAGEESLCELAAIAKADMVVNAIIGMAGLKPTLAAIEAGKTLGLANKESLVVAGSLLTEKIQFNNQLLPIDSEHSAIFQILEGNSKRSIDKIILTASGGPFFGKSRLELKNVSVEQAVNHPNWSMGKKISIDSATMMNKGLELIEASVLFGVKPENIDIVIHKESVIHSMVQFIDGSVIAQLSVPDMRLPIQYAIFYPHRVVNTINKIDFYNLKNLSFDKPDFETFKSLNLAIDVAKKGNVYPCVLNAANEEAVEMFLLGKIKFTDIDVLVKSAIDEHKEIENFTLKDIFEVDEKVRNFVKKMVF